LPKIFKLEQHVADLIAAGEVVQRPASVVKELMENSIDAGAGIVTVEIASGGMTYIRVTDNGSGIAAEDAKTAFLRHATSKLRDAQGLEAIGTLGFRGEALAAIAAVSRIVLQTRQPCADEGVALTLEAGEVLDISPAGCPEGTTIIVRDLFYNTPARLKFMKSDRAEGSAVASVVLKCALSRPDISIRFIKDGKTEYHTPGDSRADSCIYSLLGRDIEAGFMHADISDETVSVSGFITKPAASRGNRSYQFFFVNGRSIRSLLLQSALEQAYKNTLPAGRFPACVLYITIKLSSVDVNVHPAKTEVKFTSDKQVFDGVYYAASGALERTRSIVNAEYDMQGTGAPEKTQSTKHRAQTGKIGPAAGGGFRSMQSDEFRSAYISESSKEYKEPANPLFSLQPDRPDNAPHRDRSVISLDYSKAGSRGMPREALPREAKWADAQSAPLQSTPDFRVIGEALNVYIIVEYQDSVWFIDKHAAHERLHFDALMSGAYEPMSESLIMPVICRFKHEDATLLLENEAFLDTLGFSVESFGEDAVAVRHIPADIDIGDTEYVLSEICAGLGQNGTAEPAGRDNIYKAIACKAAIKAGHASGISELEALAVKVMSGEVSHCPHGRPVAFEISKSTLDKGFKRI